MSRSNNIIIAAILLPLTGVILNGCAILVPITEVAFDIALAAGAEVLTHKVGQTVEAALDNTCDSIMNLLSPKKVGNGAPEPHSSDLVIDKHDSNHAHLKGIYQWNETVTEKDGPPISLSSSIDAPEFYRKNGHWVLAKKYHDEAVAALTPKSK